MENTNVTDHHIQGYNAQNEYINIPLISEIKPNLWMGGCVDGCNLPDDFDYVLSLYHWEKYTTGPHTETQTVTMYDADQEPNRNEIDTLAKAVLAHWWFGQKVLVHCQAGLNRSGLITARALMIDGASAEDAISLLREKRDPFVLCNKAFERFLKKVGEI